MKLSTGCLGAVLVSIMTIGTATAQPYYNIEPPLGSQGTYPADYYWLNGDVPQTEEICSDRAERVRTRTYALKAPVRGRTNFTRKFAEGYGDGAYDDDHDPTGKNGYFNLPLFEVPLRNARDNDCIVVQFSGVARVADNRMLFQASIDGVPMAGHTLLGFDHYWEFLPDGTKVGMGVPVVILDADYGARAAYGSRLGVMPWTPFSFTFAGKLTPGLHVLRIKWAGCCSGGAAYAPPIEIIETATLVVTY